MTQRPYLPQVLAVSFAYAVAAPAQAVSSDMTSAAYTGLGITPNAHVVRWGHLSVGYESQLPGIVRDTAGQTYTLGFGLLPNLEIAGRLATNDLHSNCFVQPGCGARDLAGSAKLGIPLDRARTWTLGAGMTDFGGAATYARAYYGVLTYDTDVFQATAGLAKRSGNGIQGSKSPLNGPLLSAAWQPMQTFRAHVEYTDGKAWAGARVYAPLEWLPAGWQLSAGLNQRLSNTNLTERSWFSVGLSIPLYRTAQSSSTSTAKVAQASPRTEFGERNSPSNVAPSGAPASTTADERGQTAPAASQGQAQTATTIAVPPDQLRQLAKDLSEAGLDDVSVGLTPDKAVAVRISAGAYRVNSVDAVGAALGVIARNLTTARSGYRLVLTQRGVPITGVTGQADCLKDWITLATNTCPAGELTTPGFVAVDNLHAGTTWVVQPEGALHERVRVQLAPLFRTAVGTELGAFDYSLGAALNTQIPLWRGAFVDASYALPIDNSRTFEAGQVFSNNRIKARLERAALTQVWRLPLERWATLPAEANRLGVHAITGQVSAGRYAGIFDGALAGVRWEPGDGRNRLSVETGVFNNNQLGQLDNPYPRLRTAKLMLASYRYSFLPTRTDLEATAGQFLTNDKGVQLTMRQWFDDVNVSVYYKRSTFPIDVRAVQLLGIQVTFPFGPRKDVTWDERLQLGGSARYSQGLETTIRTGVGGNPISGGRGIGLPATGINDLMNSDRTGMAWWQDNLRHVRSAALSAMMERR